VNILDGKAFKAATGDGGWLGPIRRSVTGTFNGTLVHHIGDDWSWRAGQAVFMLPKMRDSIPLMWHVSVAAKAAENSRPEHLIAYP